MLRSVNRALLLCPQAASFVNLAILSTLPLQFAILFVQLATMLTLFLALVCLVQPPAKPAQVQEILPVLHVPLVYF